ncbi:MAG TPA: family 16 glycosylhydrolase [Verrucomicrobiae bacterium]|nr:family 16 glycosylhydrolase [Verrucomicrobiae bacterium]
MKSIRPLSLAAILVASTGTAMAQTPQIFQEFNPWTGNISPDGIWRKNGVWVATGGNTFDPARCILTTSYPGEASSGFLTLRSLANSLNGAEIQTLPKYKYGYYETRLKVTGVGDPANNRGVVVSFFIADYDNSAWEVDIEFLTNGSWINSPNSGQVTFNYHLPFGGGSAVHYQDLPFNPKNAFHLYGFLYQPGRLDWTVDGVIVYTVNNPGFTNPYGAYIMMNSWTGNSNWGGLAPTQDADSVYDWVKFYPDVTSVPGSGQPDLIVTDLSWSPANPAPGNGVTFSATIKNQGTAATPSGVIHGVLFSVDGTPVTWSDNSTASLAPGASRVVTANGGPSGSSTWTATAGTHTILANVDDVNRIAESNENNNTLSAPMTVGGATPPAPPTSLSATVGKKKVTLHWVQSTSANLTQNKIYRSTTGSGGPYSLRATIAATTSYTETGLTSGQEYFYVVTAVNSSGQESAFSNYIGATPR